MHFYDKVMQGLPGRDAQIEAYCDTIRAVGAAGIPVLGYHFMPNSVWRTERLAPGRGGAGCTAFDMELVDAIGSAAELRQFLPTSLGWQERMPVFGPGEAVIDAETMWANYAYFIRAVLPVAEEAGVMPGAASRTIRRCRCSAASRGSSMSRPGSAGPGSSARAARPGGSISASAAAPRCRAARPTCAR